MASSTPQPYSLLIGTIVGAYGSLNWYDVITDFGRYSCSYHGLSAGIGGVQNSGGISPGAKVWLAAQPDQLFGHILLVMNPNWSVNEDDPKSFAVYPQVSGVELNEGLTGKILGENLADLQNRPTDVMQDLVNGEWAMNSPRGGGGLGVELFRSWIRGGPMSGLTCFHDTELTRLTGAEFEFLTLSRDDYEHRHGNSIVSKSSKVFYPAEALQDVQPRELTISGPIHGGTQRFLGQRAVRGVPRVALFHEMLADDGSYVLTSASTVCLQRYCGVTIPEESQATQDPNAPELVGEQPLDLDPAREAALQAPRPAVSLPSDERSGLGWAQHTLDLIDGLTGLRGRGGFDRLPIQWPSVGLPTERPANPSQVKYDSAMWRSLPVSFQVQIDPIVAAKTFYVGRSSFTLLPDGGVLVEDAYHGQILMSGGNIMFSAPHDIVFSAGRSITAIAGKHIGIRADQNIDLASNDGSVHVKAAGQLSMLGGANGLEGGVLIESKTLRHESVAGTGQTQLVGGIVMKSASGLYGVANTVGFKAIQDYVVLDAASRVDIRGDIVTAYAPLGMYIAHDKTGASPGYEFTPSATVMPGSLVIQGTLEATGGGLFGQSLVVGGSIGAVGAVVGSSVGKGKPVGVGKAIDQLGKIFKDAKANIVSLATPMTTLLALKTPLNETFVNTLGFTFWTSKQLGVAGKDAYELPESRWQSMSRQEGLGAGAPWSENPVVSPAGDNLPTSPFPGFEVWTTAESYRLSATDLYVDLHHGAATISGDPTVAALPVDTKVPLDGNFLIGND